MACIPSEGDILTNYYWKSIVLAGGWFGKGWFGRGWFGQGLMWARGWFGRGWFGRGWFGQGMIWSGADLAGDDLVRGWFGGGYFGRGYFERDDLAGAISSRSLRLVSFDDHPIPYMQFMFHCVAINQIFRCMLYRLFGFTKFSSFITHCWSWWFNSFWGCTSLNFRNWEQVFNWKSC